VADRHSAVVTCTGVAFVTYLAFDLPYLGVEVRRSKGEVERGQLRKADISPIVF